MRLISTETLAPGVKLSRAVYNETGQVLINNGIPLTPRMIDRLAEFDITFVYIEDEKTADIETSYPISEELRQKALKTISNTFDNILKEEFVKRSLIIERTGKEMMNVVRNIIEELKGNKEVISLLSDVFTYDDYIFTHSLNVTIYSIALATELKLKPKQIEQIGLGAMLHDVGKIFVPREVLLKPGKLTNEEYDAIKKHTEDGFNMLRSTSTIPLVAAHCAYQHHERLDGSGYPRGIKEAEIHLFAKIIGVADVFDAVTSNRVYRSAMLPHEGLEILYSGVGKLFDKELVEAFRKSVAVYPNGLTVELSDGRKGVVSIQHPHVCDRPTIRILEDGDLQVATPYELDLIKHLNVVITACDTTLMSKV